MPGACTICSAISANGRWTNTMLPLIKNFPSGLNLSEKTESIILNKNYPFSIGRFFSDIGRGMLIALRNTLWQTGYMICILFLALVPILGWTAPLLSLIIECFYLGFSMLDYTNERKGLSYSRSIDFINRHKGLAIGNGLIFYRMHLFPIVGWILAPGYSVIAATLSLQERKPLKIDR